MHRASGVPPSRQRRHRRRDGAYFILYPRARVLTLIRSCSSPSSSRSRPISSWPVVRSAVLNAAAAGTGGGWRGGRTSAVVFACCCSRVRRLPEPAYPIPAAHRRRTTTDRLQLIRPAAGMIPQTFSPRWPFPPGARVGAHKLVSVPADSRSGCCASSCRRRRRRHPAAPAGLGNSLPDGRRGISFLKSPFRADASRISLRDAKIAGGTLRRWVGSLLGGG